METPREMEPGELAAIEAYQVFLQHYQVMKSLCNNLITALSSEELLHEGACEILTQKLIKLKAQIKFMKEESNTILTEHFPNITVYRDRAISNLQALDWYISTIEEHADNMQFLLDRYAKQPEALYAAVQSTSAHAGSSTWVPLGKGTYNLAYRSGDSVFKAQRKPNDKTDSPERSVRLWNTINPDIHPPARVITHDIPVSLGSNQVIIPVQGWELPFIEGVPASQEEIVQKLVEIYSASGRVVADAISPNNFMKTPEGKVVCVDIGMALQLDKRNGATLVGLRRKPSMDSLDAWRNTEDGYQAYFAENQYNPMYAQSVAMVKALLFIQKQRPDIKDVGFLLRLPDCVTQCVLAYDAMYSVETEESAAAIHDALLQLRMVHTSDLEQIKSGCRQQFETYLQSYAITVQEDESLSYAPDTFSRSLFIDAFSYKRRAAMMTDLMIAINTAETREDCIEAVDRAYDDYILSSRSASPVNVADAAFYDIEMFAGLKHDCSLCDQTVQSLKNNCLQILQRYIFNGPQSFSGNTEQILEFKLAIMMNRANDRCMRLIEEISAANNIDEVLICLEGFEVDLPNVDNPSFSAFIDLATIVQRCKLEAAATKEGLLYNYQSHPPQPWDMV